MKELFKFDSGKGFIVAAAETVERAKEMIADPSLVETGMVEADVQAALVSSEGDRLSDEELLIVQIMGLNVLTEARLMAAQTSVKLFKDESIKLFQTVDKHYIVAAKDRDDALSIIDELAATPHRDGSTCTDNCGHKFSELKGLLNEQETPRAEFDYPPKMISREVVEWYKNLPPPEPPMMPAPTTIM